MKRQTVLLVAASACLLATLPARANLVQNGDFSQGLTDWSKTSSTGYFGLNTTGGINNSADVTLTGGGLGVTVAAQLNIPLTPGQLYALTFSDYVSPPEPNSNPSGNGQTAVNGILNVDQLIVGLDGAPTQTINYTQLSTSTFVSGSYQTFTLYFTDVSSPGNLSFQWISSDASGSGVEQQNIQLDDVSLVAVPEPTTLISGALLLLPFGASTVRILRKKLFA
jgi:hypothetical protein